MILFLLVLTPCPKGDSIPLDNLGQRVALVVVELHTFLTSNLGFPPSFFFTAVGAGVSTSMLSAMMMVMVWVKGCARAKRES